MAAEEEGEAREGDSLARCRVIREGENYQLKQSAERSSKMETEYRPQKAKAVSAQCDSDWETENSRLRQKV